MLHAASKTAHPMPTSSHRADAAGLPGGQGVAVAHAASSSCHPCWPKHRQGTLQDFEADKASLLRMLADFQAEQGGRELVAAAKPRAEASSEGLPGMDFLMQRYESELKKPIRSIVNGQLARSLLIQVRWLMPEREGGGQGERQHGELD